MKKLAAVLTATFLLAGTIGAQAATYNIDHAHTEFGFSVAHLVITKTKGRFAEFEGTLKYDADDAAVFMADVTIQAKSIDTNNDKRDDHLRNPDFFDTDNHPTITFKSSTLEPQEDGTVHIIGDLTMRGTTKEVAIPATIQGPVANPFGGGDILGLSGSVTIDRQEWGIAFNKALETGGFVVGDDVTLTIEIEAHAQAVEEKSEMVEDKVM